MAIDPKLVSIVKAEDLPSKATPDSNDEFLIYDGDNLKKSTWSNVTDYLSSGIVGEAIPATDPPETGFYRYIVHTAGTYTNFLEGGVPIEVTTADLDGNLVFLEVTDNVAKKDVIALQEGKSAYEVAVDNGFVGTESEWLESLKAVANPDNLIEFRQSGYNYANPDAFVVGRLNATTGLPSGSTFKTSEFIEWGDNQRVYTGYVNETTGNSGSVGMDICQYDINGDYLGVRDSSGAVQKAPNAVTFRVSFSGYKFPIIAFVPMVNIPLFAYFKPYVDKAGGKDAVFQTDIIQNVELIPNENLVSTAEYLPKSYFDSTLSGIRYVGASTTSVIRVKVKPSTTYSRDKNTLFSANFNAVGFLKDKDRPSEIQAFSNDLTFTTPADCNYIVVTGNKNNNITIVEGSAIKSIAPAVELISKEGFPVFPTIPFTSGKNKFDKGTMIIPNKLVNYSTKTIVNNAGGAIAIIPVTPSMQYSRSTKNTNVTEVYQGVLELVTYDFETGAYTVNQGYNLDTFTVSANAKYIAVTIAHGGVSIADTLQVELGSNTTAYEPFEKIATLEEKFQPYVTQELIDAVVAAMPNSNTITDMKEIKNLPSNYETFLDDSNFRIYAPKRKITDISNDIYPKMVAVGGNVAIWAFNAYTIEISENGIEGLSYVNNSTNENRITLNSTVLPNSVDSTMQSVHVLPYRRVASPLMVTNDYRVIIVTRGGHIYHNKPQRTANGSDYPIAGDHLLFEQSVVWDMPHRRLPHSSNNTFPYYKNPCVPTPIYSPLLPTDSGFVDTYGNGGFPISKTEGGVARTRFLIRHNGVNQNPFRTMGGVIIEPSNMWIASYFPSTELNKTVRLCVFNTKDGREFYNIYEFIPSNLIGTPLDTTTLPAYNANSLSMLQIDPDFPKEGYTPTTLFKETTEIAISNISNATTAVVTTATAHGLFPQGIIAIQTNGVVQSEYSWMLNDGANSNSAGNNLFFAYKKLTDTTFELHEYVGSNTTFLQARHIHALNRAKDGITISTGEEYYTRQPSELSPVNIEGYYPQSHFVHFTTRTNVATKVNSSENGLMRSLGFILMDDLDQTVLSASDSDIAGKDVTTVDGTLYRGATGLFKGKLIDINDRTKFDTILESPDVAFFFQKVGDVYIYADVRGFVGVSTDLVNWSTTYVLGTIFKNGGLDRLNRVVVDGVIIYKK